MCARHAAKKRQKEELGKAEAAAVMTDIIIFDLMMIINLGLFLAKQLERLWLSQKSILQLLNYRHGYLSNLFFVFSSLLRAQRAALLGPKKEGSSKRDHEGVVKSAASMASESSSVYLNQAEDDELSAQQREAMNSFNVFNI